MAATIAVTRERHQASNGSAETRVAVTPDTVKKFVALGAVVTVEAGAGAGASLPDADYVAAGATIAPTVEAALAGADILLKVRGPSPAEMAALKPGAVVVGLFNPYQDRTLLDGLAARGVTAFEMSFVRGSHARR
jgi:NAD(P) transhydrogenase subunit alpha